MYLSSTGCCAVKEICDLSAHRTARAAMQAFCKSHKYYGEDKLGSISAFVTFTGVTKITKREYEQPSAPTYGQTFAKFIIDNNLGAVSESVSRVNRCNHPNHTVKVWVWCPSIKNLNAWWIKNKKV